MFKETCGEIFGQVRFAGAVAGCGVRSRVRFTCGQTFARKPGSDIYILSKMKNNVLFDVHNKS